MIIYTNSNIEKINPNRLSKVIEHASAKVCLAEVPDEFNLSQDKMLKHGIDFWYELSIGYFNHEDFDYEYFLDSKQNIVEAIERTYNVAKERNIALAIHTLSNQIGEDAIDFFNKYCE